MVDETLTLQRMQILGTSLYLLSLYNLIEKEVKELTEVNFNI